MPVVLDVPGGLIIGVNEEHTDTGFLVTLEALASFPKLFVTEAYTFEHGQGSDTDELVLSRCHFHVSGKIGVCVGKGTLPEIPVRSIAVQQIVWQHRVSTANA